MNPHRLPPLVPTPQYLRRVALHFAIGSLILLGSLLAGMAGYRYFEGLGWLDSFLNAAMLLGGEGPLKSPQTPGGKLFAGAYALYSGIVFIVAAGFIFAPTAHRLLHRFHWEDSELESGR